MNFKILKTKFTSISKQPAANLSPDEKSSIEKIKQLQDEIDALQEQRTIKGQYYPADIIIENILETDSNIKKRNKYGYSKIDSNYNKEWRNKCMNFVSLFDIIEDSSKEKLINYLTHRLEVKHMIQEIDNQIISCKQKIKSEKDKLGIK